MLSVVRKIADPYFRYRHARLIHAIRVSLSVLLSILLTTSLALPHGQWASITVLVVIGGLQHQGNIRRKAFERGMGTLIGAAFGLLMILQRSAFDDSVATYLMIAAACGFCAYEAIGKGGYIALLSAITIVIVAGHGDSSIADGLWRTVNIVIGIVIALIFSFALPLYATWSWRYKFADTLRGCARLRRKIIKGTARPGSGELAALGALLVQLRSLIPWVAKETHIAVATLEEIQRSLRLCISSLDLLLGFRQRDVCDEDRHIATMFFCMASALKNGNVRRLVVPAQVSSDGDDLTLRLRDEVIRLRQLLAETASHWNI